MRLARKPGEKASTPSEAWQILLRPLRPEHDCYRRVSALTHLAPVGLESLHFPHPQVFVDFPEKV